MTQSIQETWDKFNRWENRYRNVSHSFIDEMFHIGYSDFDGGLFISNSCEINYEMISGTNLVESDLYERIDNKINFLRGYLADISFDGPKFMMEKSKFLTLQYPSRCNNAMGVWLEQDLEGGIEAGAYSYFQEFDVNFFCNNIKDVDLASMKRILPFDRMFIRQAKGQQWVNTSIEKILKQIEKDLGYEYEFKMKPKTLKGNDLLQITFIWNE